MTLLGDILKAFLDRELPLDLAVRIEASGALSEAWQSAALEDVLTVRFRLGLPSRAQRALVQMVGTLLQCDYVAGAYPSQGQAAASTIYGWMLQYLDGHMTAENLDHTTVETRRGVHSANWTHPASAAYHIALAITAAELAKVPHATGARLNPRLWQLHDGVKLAKYELHQRGCPAPDLRADFEVPTAHEIFAAILGHGSVA